MFDFIKDNPITFLLIFLAIAAPSLFFGALQVIFYIVLGIVILLLILSLVFRARITRLQREMEEQMGGSARGAQGNRGGFSGFSGFSGFNNRAQGGSSRRRSDEGDVKIFKQAGAQEKKVAKDVGDYVDFEEVKERY